VTKSIDENTAVSVLFNYFREHGFPDYTRENYNVNKEMLKLQKYDEKQILQNNKYLKQTMHSCGFLWTYFPHWKEVQCGDNGKTVLDSWNDDETLKKLIKKTWNWQLKHGNGKFTINRIRQNAKVYGAKQSVSNFRPTVAKYIYNTYGNKGKVWDMSSGWGGRLFGFLASDCHTYVGTEPSTKTYNGLCELKNDYTYLKKNVEILKCGSEDYEPIERSFDLCFTSPPYFDTEKYSEEKTQSFIKYNTRDSWLNEFMRKTLENCKYGLKDTGYLIVNISNVKTYKTLESDFMNLCKELGFYHIDTLYLILSSIGGKGVKTEPVFIFKKKG
jgi:hypothetical protein